MVSRPQRAGQRSKFDPLCKERSGLIDDAVTVIIPAYNAAAFVNQAVQSARAAFGPAAALVVDDGSDDDTAVIAERHGARVIKHPSNRGTASALNTGVVAAGSRYVAWLSADDLYTPGAADLYRQAMAAQPDADIYFGRYLVQDMAGRQLGISPERVGLLGESGPRLCHDWFVDMMFACFINGSTSILRRERLIELGLFDPSFHYGHDHALWLQLAYHHATAVFIGDVVGIRREHEAQSSRNPVLTSRARMETRQYCRRFYAGEGRERIHRRLDSAGAHGLRLRARLIKRYLGVGLLREAWNLFRTSKRHPSVAALVVDEMLDSIRRGHRLGRLTP